MPNKAQQGFTLIEFLVTVAVMLIFFTIAVLIINPAQERAKARDNKRLSDMALIDRVINEYLLDHGAYPDAEDTLRNSTALPDAQTLGLDNSSSGWIDQNLAKYTARLPIDPLNNATYKYEYIHDTSSYEINCRLEELTSYLESDSGDNDSKYELGNNLVLIY